MLVSILRLSKVASNIGLIISLVSMYYNNIYTGTIGSAIAVLGIILNVMLSDYIRKQERF